MDAGAGPGTSPPARNRRLSEHTTRTRLLTQRRATTQCSGEQSTLHTTPPWIPTNASNSSVLLPWSA